MRNKLKRSKYLKIIRLEKKERDFQNFLRHVDNLWDKVFKEYPELKPLFDNNDK